MWTSHYVITLHHVTLYKLSEHRNYENAWPKGLKREAEGPRAGVAEILGEKAANSSRERGPARPGPARPRTHFWALKSPENASSGVNFV